ncbi:TonB-dependent receptor [Prevotella sp. oral taxon 376]|nr:TonB-dependent receptor [Prevotella sp. oral taxon 376]PTL34351.1 TonB-dependent receptor [Prevotella sp. oral taxon 376]
MKTTIKERRFLRPIEMLALAILLSIATPLRAEDAVKDNTDANLIGHVVHQRTQEHLPHFGLYVVGTLIKTSTDATGHYHLKNLPVGQLLIEARSAGYKPVRKMVVMERDKTCELNFEVEEDEVSLEEVVVSANRNLTLRRESPTVVNILDGKLFEITQSGCLAQGLNFQPGVRTEDNCQNCGFSQVRINGLDGHYSQILIDSRPVFSALQGVYGLEQIPSNMIERVEVVRGGGSALYGASAIGGTINIITKEPSGNSAEAAHSIMSIGGKGRFDNNTTVNASIVADNNKAGLYVYGQNHYRAGYDHDGDGYTELPVLRNQTIGLNSYLRLSDYSRLSLRYHGLSEYRRGGNLLHLPAHEANIAEQLDHAIHGGGLGYELYAPDGRNRLSAYLAFEHVDRKSYYGGTGDGSAQSMEAARKAYSLTRDLNLMGGVQFVHGFRRLLLMPATLTMGMEYSYDGLEDESLGYDYRMRQRVRVASGYVQNEWKNEHWGLLVGGRVDKHNLIRRAIFSPRVNVRYNPVSNINLRLVYAGGFRAPQAFDEDLHTTIAGGERVVTRLSSGLKEERSHSFSLSADLYKSLGSVQTNLLIEGFYTRLNNVFAERKLAETDGFGNRISERYNANSADVFGMSIEGKAAFTSWFSLQAGITLQRSLYARAVEWDEEAPALRKMLRTPDAYGYFTATFTPVRNLSISFSGNYTGRMTVPHAAGSGVEKPVAEETPSFLALNFKASYGFRVHDLVRLQLSGGVQNLANSYQKDFDKGWNRDAGYIYGPSLPRSLFLGLKVFY